MPTEILSALPQLVEIVTKAGVIGLLIIVTLVLGWELRRQRAETDKRRVELSRAYRQRDRWRLAYTICKAACDQHDIEVDLRDVDDLIKEDASPA